MTDRSALGAFLTVTRNFGLTIALRVTYSKVRGWICPALALPRAPTRNVRHRELSILLSTIDQSATTLSGVAEVVARHSASNWEICICERPPLAPEVALTLARLRGTQPWIRIVTSDESVDEATAAQWTVEQATGRFVALMAPGSTPDAATFERLLAHLHSDSGIDAAVLLRTNNDSGALPSPIAAADCQLLLQRKSAYLSTFPLRLELRVAAVASELREIDATKADLAGMVIWMG